MSSTHSGIGNPGDNDGTMPPMTDTLRDQLLGLGFKPAPKPEKPPHRDGAGGHAQRPNTSRQNTSRPPTSRADASRPNPPRAGAQNTGAANAGKPNAGRPHPNAPGRKPEHGRAQANRPQHSPGKPRTREDIDLAKAYAIRAQREKDERIEAERLKQDDARKRREAKIKLAELLKDKGLNDANADIARHFDYGGKIKRIHVTADQLKSLNAGELGVVQLDGRYLLVSAALLAQAEAIFAPAVALKVDMNAPATDHPYADPQFQVPDDLVW